MADTPDHAPYRTRGDLDGQEGVGAAAALRAASNHQGDDARWTIRNRTPAEAHSCPTRVPNDRDPVDLTMTSATALAPVIESRERRSPARRRRIGIEPILAPTRQGAPTSAQSHAWTDR